MKIELYAPVDCEVKSITQSTDSTFADKMLGDGILIIPKNKTDEFKSPFLKAKIAQVFETKHAIWFNVENVNALIHCGLETVSLNGQPFETKIKADQNISKDSVLFNVDWDFIRSKKLSCETPIVFEINDKSSIKIKITNTNAKQGDKIAEIEFIESKLEDSTLKQNVESNNFKIGTFKNKYRKTAEAIFEYIGGEGNYKNVYNCMTRFRTNITDQSKVKIDLIKKLDIVKGVQYNGSELQIIIGGEVVKVVDEFKSYEASPRNKNGSTDIIIPKISMGKRILSAIAGIVGPSIPAIMASGIFGALYAILTQTGAIQTIGDVGQINGSNLGSGLVFLLNKTILNGLGIFILFNFVKYFNGETMYAIALGLLLSSRGFFPGSGMPDGWTLADAGFGDWINANGKQGFLLFTMGNLPIVVGGYEGSVLPYIAAGTIIVFLNKWVKTWMPSVIDIIFRPTIVIGIAAIGTWFIFGPIMGIIEFGLVTGLTEAGKLPGGIGVGLMALIWQPLVLTGCHVGVVMPIVVAMNQTPQALMAGIGIGVWGQVGAVIGVALATKNYTLKSLAYGSVVGGIFGVTEPIIYGVNLPRVKPFVLGCLAAFPIGMLSGILGIDADIPGGLGIFAIFGYGAKGDTYVEQLLLLMCWVLVIALAAVLVFFLYSERKDEYKEVKKTTKMISIFTVGNKDKNLYKQSLIENDQKFEELYSQIKHMKLSFKDVANHISSQTKYESLLVLLEDKESQKRGKLYNKLLKIRNKLLSNVEKQSPELIAKFNKVNKEYESFNMDTQKNEIQSKINKSIDDFEEKLKSFEIERAKLIDELNAKIDLTVKDENSELVKNQVWNAMYSVEIGYGMEDPKQVKVIK